MNPRFTLYHPVVTRGAMGIVTTPTALPVTPYCVSDEWDPSHSACITDNGCVAHSLLIIVYSTVHTCIATPPFLCAMPEGNAASTSIPINALLWSFCVILAIVNAVVAVLFFTNQRHNSFFLAGFIRGGRAKTRGKRVRYLQQNTATRLIPPKVQ